MASHRHQHLRGITAGIAAGAMLGCVPDSVAPGDYGVLDASDANAAMTGDEGDDPSDATPVSTNDGEAGATSTGDAAPAGPCDLTGRWLVSVREVSTAIGAVEAAHIWMYYELTQAGSAITVSKGLNCGENVRGVSSVAANTDYPNTWPAMQTNCLDTGRKGTSTETASGCQVAFEKRYAVIGATESFYVDPSQALPTASQQATASAPGWEDWDNDGKPGFTMDVTGLATGQLYMVTRSWSTFTGTVALGSTTFTLPTDWDSDVSVLGINGPSLLTEAASSSKDSDATQHFTVFARLGANQGTGSDTAICAAIRSLAPTLAPSAQN